MKEFTIDWRVGGSFTTEAETKEEAVESLFDDFEFILQDAVGWRQKAVYVEEEEDFLAAVNNGGEG